MPNEKEDLKNQLESIKKELDKKLSEVEKNNQNKTKDNPPKSKKSNKSKSNQIKKKKPIAIQVGMEVVSSGKKEENRKEKPNSKVEDNRKSSTPKKKKVVLPKGNKAKKKKKKSPILIPAILLVVFLLGILGYIYSLKENLKQEESKFEKEKQEAIDYREDVYFKEVEDEVDDEEMQDFAVYKDVPEVVAESNTETQVLSKSDQKNIDQQIVKNQTDQLQFVENKTDDQGQNSNENTAINTNTDQTNADLSQTDDKVQKTNTTDNTIKKDEVFSDLIKVVALQHKDGNFTLPKKAKKTNAFKVRVRLKKNQISDNENDVEIMLVIKEKGGNTIKIDSKKVNFKKQQSKVLYLEFYEIFPERLKTNMSYSFSVFANKKLLKTFQKSI